MQTGGPLMAHKNSLKLHHFICILGLFAACFARAGSYEDFFSAIEHDRVDTVQQLLDRGFDPNTVNEKGIPALVLAAQSNAVKSQQVLIQAKQIQLNSTNHHGENALMLAAIHNQLDIAKRLIEKGAEVNKKGWSPLHYAATKGHVQMMRLLMENDAYLDAEAPNGTTPLMMAAQYGTPSAVKLLLEEGADPRIENKLGLDAFEFAKHAAHPQAEDTRRYIEAFLSDWQRRYPPKTVNSTKAE
jgi:ankyrin repeat protein